MEGRWLVIGMEVGGCTQYLAKVQGMPKHIEKILSSIICNFMWKGDQHPLVGMGTLIQPILAGGFNVLNINVQNEAIQLTWLASCLNLSPNRLTWAFVADALIAENTKKRCGTLLKATRTNVFLQHWEAATHASFLQN